MSYVDTIRDTNETILVTIDDALTQASKILPPLIRWGVQEWVDRQAFGAGALIPDGWVDEAADVIIDGAMKLIDYGHEVVAVYRIANRYLGSPDALRALADAIKAVGDKSEEIQISRSLLTGLMSWDDPPQSNVYSESVSEQSEPVGRITTAASSFASAIDTHANDIENYYLDLATFVGGALTTVTGVITAAIGLAGAIPTAGVSLALSIIGLIEALVGVVMTIVGAVKLVVTTLQGSAAKIDLLRENIPTWKAPGFAIVQ
jgi:hypothetical protein